MMPPDQYGNGEFKKVFSEQDHLAGRLDNIERILGLLINHPVLAKVVQGGPFAIPQGGFLLEGKQVIGGSPSDLNALAWSNANSRYEPRNVGASAVGGIHYDFIVDANYAGVAGESMLGPGGSITRLYATIQAAITQADADNDSRSIRINAGNYPENVTVPATFSHDLWIEGEAIGNTPHEGGGVSIGTGAGTRFTFSGTGQLTLKNVMFLAGGAAFATSGSDKQVRMENVHAPSTSAVSGHFQSLGTTEDCVFLNCSFEGGFNPSQLYNCRIVSCFIAGGTWSGTVERTSIVGCVFSDVITITGTIENVTFSGNSNVRSGGLSFLRINNTGTYTKELSIVGNTFYSMAGNPTIWLDDTNVAAITAGIAVVGNSFMAQVSGSVVVYIQSDVAQRGWCIVGNTFGRVAGFAGDDYIEDSGGVSVSGIFVDSVIGPNTPPDFDLQADAGSSGSVYIGTGDISGAGASGVTKLGGSALFDEGIALTSRTNVDIIGAYIQAQDDATALATKIRQGWIGQEAVVDSAQHVTLDSGTATSGGAGVLNDIGKAWAVNNFARCQVVITGGTGYGQVRTVISNTATQLTVAAWTTNPDATSTYLIQPGIRVYRQLIEAINAGHRSISFRSDNTPQPATIDTSSAANPTTVTTTTPHGLVTGQRVRITGHTDGALNLDAGFVATVTGATTFTIPVLSGGGTGGRVSVLLVIDSAATFSYLLGDSPGDASVQYDVTCDKTGAVFDALRFSGARLRLGSSSTLGQSCTVVGCRFDATNAYLVLSGNGSSAIACTFVAAGASGVPCINPVNQDHRIQACSFRLISGTNLIASAATSTLRLVVVGNINLVGGAETGYLVDISSTSSNCSISGNIFSMPTSASGAINVAGFASNVSGNMFQALGSFTTTGTWDFIVAGSRQAISSNTFRISGIAGGANSPVINCVRVVGVAVAVTGNAAFLVSISGANAIFNGVAIDAGQRLTNIANNVFFCLTFSSGSVNVVNPADAGAADCAMANNIAVGTTATSAPSPWVLITRMNQDSVLAGNTGMPALSAWRHETVEDFTDDGLPHDWEQDLTGGGTTTFGANTLGGVVQLATGAVANNDVVLRHNLNHINGSGASPMFEAVFELDDVGSVRFRVGLGEYASWVPNMARPATGLFLELDTAIDANFHVIMKTAVTTQNIDCGVATVGIHRVSAFLGRGNHLHVYFDGVRQGGAPSSSGAWAALVCEGIFLRTLAAVDKPTDVDLVRAGCDRV